MCIAITNNDSENILFNNVLPVNEVSFPLWLEKLLLSGSILTLFNSYIGTVILTILQSFDDFSSLHRHPVLK